jgi:hypothetical protein
MASLVLTDARIYAGPADLTGQSNEVAVAAEVDEKDATTFGSGGWKELKGGLKSGPISAKGFFAAGDAAQEDDSRWAALATVEPWTLTPTDSIVTAVAYLTKVLNRSLSWGDAVGELNPYAAEGVAAWPITRGQIAHPPGTARTASGTGTALNLGAVPAGKRLYASLHVLSIAGTATPTITCVIETDSASGFASPTTVASFTAATAIGGQIIRTDGSAITDTYQRLKWTISGTTPSFLLVAAIGIGD